jgi:hypothetical protein
MIEGPMDFALNAVAGAVALLCLFESTRRLGAYGVHRKAMLMFVLSASVCALYGGFAYQRYGDLKSRLSANQPKPGQKAVVANWSKAHSAEQKELLSQALARESFRASGTLGQYVGRNGETKGFAPTQEDLAARERLVASYSREQFAARTTLAESVLWLIAAVVAVFLGLAMSLDNKPPVRVAQDGLQGDLK